MSGLSAEVCVSNWDFLIHKLMEGESWIAVEKRFRAASEEELARLLRDHRSDTSFDPEEIAFRRQVDDVLQLSCRLYLAWICGYVPDPAARQAERPRLQKVLSSSALRHYYEDLYPLAIPWLLRLHLERTVSLPSEEDLAGAGAFERVSILDERIREDRDLRRFLDFLDGFWYGTAESRIDLNTVIDSFQDPDRVAEAFARKSGQITPLDQGIVGLVRFLTLCNDLDDLLERCKPMPLVWSAIWFHYAYWFNEYRADAVTKASQALDKIIVAAGAKNPEIRSAVGAEREDWSKILDRLTDGRCAQPLVEAVERRASAPDWVARFSHYGRSAQEKAAIREVPVKAAVPSDSVERIKVPESLRDVLVAAYRVAPAIHQAYLRGLPDDQWGRTFDKPFEQLDYDGYVSNIAAALRIPWVLSLIGCSLSPGRASPGEESEIADLINGNLEYLAEAEHEGWMAQKVAAGWSYGEVRDDRARQNPFLIPYAALPETEKEKDRRNVRHYPAYARLSELKIVRSPHEADANAPGPVDGVS